MDKKILIIEDSIEVARMIKVYLKGAGYDVRLAHNGLEGLKQIKNIHFDLAIIDLKVEFLKGVNLIREIRAISEFPIMLMTTSVEDVEPLRPYGLIPEDILEKPINPKRLIKQVEDAIENYFTIKPEYNSKVYTFDQLLLDCHKMKLFRDEVEITLTSTEYIIIKLLMKYNDRVVTKREMCEVIYGDYYQTDEKSLIVHISHLRDKIGLNSNRVSYIKTIRGQGYSLH